MPLVARFLNSTLELFLEHRDRTRSIMGPLEDTIPRPWFSRLVPMLRLVMDFETPVSSADLLRLSNASLSGDACAYAMSLIVRMAPVYANIKSAHKVLNVTARFVPVLSAAVDKAQRFGAQATDEELHRATRRRDRVMAMARTLATIGYTEALGL